jgi:hypothetical protein
MTENGEETFLLGISYYAGLGAPDALLRDDLDRIKGLGFNWVRVWATWAAFDRDVSAVDVNGNARAAGMQALGRLLQECDRRGLIVGVTLLGEAFDGLQAIGFACIWAALVLYALDGWRTVRANARAAADARCDEHVSCSDGGAPPR